MMRPWLRNVALLGLTVALLAAFLRNADLGRVWSLIATARPVLIGGGVACLFGSYALRAVRWQVMLSPLGAARFGVALRATVIGFAASFILPARAGDVLRPLMLARREGLDPAAVFATIVIERMLDLVTVLLLLGTFLVAFDGGLAGTDSPMFRTVRAGGLSAALAAVIGFAGLIGFAARPALLPRLVAATTAWLPARWRAVLMDLAAAFGKGLVVVRDPIQLGRALCWSVVLWLVIAAQTWVVSAALDVWLPPAGALLVVAMLVVGVAVPTPGAVGGFHEAYRLAVTSFFGIDNDHAVSAAIVLHAVGFLPTLIAGAMLMASEGLSFSRLGAVAQAAKGEEVLR